MLTLSAIPESLRACAVKDFQRLPLETRALVDEKLGASFTRAFVGSAYFAASLIAEPELLPPLIKAVSKPL